MATWNDNIVRYKKSKRYKYRVANARRNRYRQSQLRLSQIAVALHDIADDSAISETPNQGSGQVRTGQEPPERQEKRLGNASPNKSEVKSEGSSSLYSFVSPSSCRTVENSLLRNADDSDTKVEQGRS